MRNVPKLTVLIALACLAVTSCTDRTPEPAAPGPILRDQTITLTDSIPTDFGDLIAVTTTEIYPNFAQLWFQKEDKSIVTVFVNYKRGVIETHPLVIPRS